MCVSDYAITGLGDRLYDLMSGATSPPVPATDPPISAALHLDELGPARDLRPPTHEGQFMTRGSVATAFPACPLRVIP